MDLKEQSILGKDAEDHWYYVSKGRALRALLGAISVPELLDVGAGSGIFARQMLEAGIAQRAVCVDTSYPREHVEHHGGKRIAFCRRIERVDQQLLLMIDVLEHVPDDLQLLRSYTDRAPRGTHVLISVPAFQLLWSGHDEFLGHERRYNKTQVENLISAAGLEVVRARYFFGALFPAVAAMRLYDRFRLETGAVSPKSALARHPPALNKLLLLLHTLECRTIFRFNRVAGLSIFCLARRLRGDPHAGDPLAPR